MTENIPGATEDEPHIVEVADGEDFVGFYVRVLLVPFPYVEPAGDGLTTFMLDGVTVGLCEGVAEG